MISSIDGVLNINKPPRLTSHDVVIRVRRIFKKMRVGHTGTLDPLATGVLVLCVGKATRIAQFIEAGEKEYRAVMRLGVTTDTLDADGRITGRRAYLPPDRNKIIEVMKNFIGSLMQQPPVYSALKVDGIPSYKLAREGKAKPLSPRPVQIYNLDLRSYDDPFVSFSVRCSRGTYVRTLCSDIGEALGMGAHLTELERTRSGHFSIQQAITLEQLENIGDFSQIRNLVISVSDALGEFPQVLLSEKESGRIQHGNQITCPAKHNETNTFFRLQDSSGRLVALAKSSAGLLKPVLVFLESP